MKTIKISLTLFLSIIVAFSSSCQKMKLTKASGDVIEVEKTVTDYTKIEVSDAFTVDVTYSDEEERIVIEADDNLQDLILVEVDNDRLIIQLDNMTNIRGNSTLKVHITTKELNSFVISDASTLTLNNELETNDVVVHVSDASLFKGAINATSGKFKLADASRVKLSGTLDFANVVGKDASKLKGFDLQTNNLDVDVSDASGLEMTINEELSVRASDASHIKYKGTGTVVSQNLSDASSIRKIN